MSWQIVLKGLRIRELFLACVLLFGCFLIACSSAEPGSQTTDETVESEELSDSMDSSRPVYELQQVIDNTIAISIDPISVSASTGLMNKNHTCEGSNISPPLTWQGVPDEAKSLVLILDDPSSDTGVDSLDGDKNGTWQNANWRGKPTPSRDGPGDRLWIHWVLYSIPPGVTELAGGQPITDVLENGSKHGMNSYGKAQYSGPCPQPTILFQQSTDARTPPITAQSRPYFVKLYALDKELNLAPMTDRDTLLQEIDGHIVGAGELSVPFKSRKKEMRRGTNVRQY